MTRPTLSLSTRLTIAGFVGTQALQRYKQTGQPWEKQAATDFLIELGMNDTKAMVKSVMKEGTP